MESRPFGRTGESVPVLGLGCQRIVDTNGCGEDEAQAILHRALDGGMRYFDTAWVYALGQSEKRLGKVAEKRRGEMWIATKTLERTCDGALRQLEESLERLRTDRVEEWRLHCVNDRAELDRCFAADGAIHALTKARDQGMVRYLGITGHSDACILSEALRRFPFDSTLFTVAPVDPGHPDFLGALLPAARASGAAVVGMRALAGGALRGICEEALRYGLGLPVSVLLAGCSTVAQLEQDLSFAESFSPFEEPERQDFLQRALRVPIRYRPF